MNDSTKDSNVITSDQPLTSEQAELLSSLLNVIIPPSDDGVMPGAGLARHAYNSVALLSSMSFIGEVAGTNIAAPATG